MIRMSENDSTVHAEALIRTVARAFYEDTAIILIDVLLRDKFLRDDADMGIRLNLPCKQMRETLRFLETEHLVKSQAVDDLAEGGSQATKFWYIDYNHAVNVIRLRIYLLQKKLEENERRIRSSSVYLCPGYKTKICNGRYTETEAQQIVDHESGLFLCPECMEANTANPDPPAKSTYTLELVDNTKALKSAMDNLRRVKVQLNEKMIGNTQLRAGIYDLIKKVRMNKGPLSSNLPIENRHMNIGSKRLAGTGRTAGVKAKKLKEQMGENAQLLDSKGNIRKYLGGTTGSDDLNFLKNAMGQQLAFEVEKGGGARANVLATGGRTRSQLLEEAAIRVGVELDLVSALAKRHKHKREEEERQDEEAKRKREAQNKTLTFLRNNIGRNDEDEEARAQRLKQEAEEDDNDSDLEDIAVVIDSDEEAPEMTDDVRRATFQASYKREFARQKQILGLVKKSNNGNAQLIPNNDDEEEGVNWEEG